MQEDFHYYATYAAAYLAGYSHEDSLDICYSTQFVDNCTATLLSGIKAPTIFATTQLNMELMDTKTDQAGLAEITGIWSAFHFLPHDLYSTKKKATKRYMHKYRLICGPNGSLIRDTVNLAKGGSLQAVGIAMHVLADTWAHMYFAGTPSFVINNTNYHFYELIPDGDDFMEREVKFVHKTSAPDDLENGIFTSTLYQGSEYSVMNLGHGRAGHFPDYSFARYKYLPAWDDYNEVLKDNPSDYIKAFSQMIYAMKYLNGKNESFELSQYDDEAIAPYRDRLKEIIEKRQLTASRDWKAFGESLSGKEIPDYDIGKYQGKYISAAPDEKRGTFLGEFFDAAARHKSMVVSKIAESKNPLAGSVAL